MMLQLHSLPSYIFILILWCKIQNIIVQTEWWTKMNTWYTLFNYFRLRNKIGLWMWIWTNLHSVFSAEQWNRNVSRFIQIWNVKLSIKCKNFWLHHGTKQTCFSACSIFISLNKAKRNDSKWSLQHFEKPSAIECLSLIHNTSLNNTQIALR
jgi:hypothetical protein